MDGWGQGVFNVKAVEKWVDGAVVGIAHFKMQVRHANARAARVAHDFTALDGQLIRAKVQVHAVRAAPRLLLLDVVLDALGKSRQVRPQRETVIVELDIDHAAVSPRRGSHAPDMPIGNGCDGVPLIAPGFQIDGRVQSPAAIFAKGRGQCRGRV